MNEKEKAVLEYGFNLFVASIQNIPPPPHDHWKHYENIVGDGRASSSLCSISSLVHLKGRPEPRPVFLQPHTLSLKTILDSQPQPTEEILKSFRKEWEQVEKQPRQSYIIAHHLVRKYASSLPAACGGEGVSLFEQWKAVAALAFASGDRWKDGPAEEFTLVSGGIPGIQDFVYTITSKGAAKGLRGRSFFLQLLGEAVIERLLRVLDLRTANVIYAAGGKFMLLAPPLSTVINGKSVADLLEETRSAMEQALLEGFQGDLALSLAWLPVKKEEIGSHAFAEKTSRKLKELIAGREQARFSGAAANHWETLFAPQGKRGNRYCAVCQRPLGKGEGKPLTGADSFSCLLCESLGKLARSLGGAEFLSVGTQKPAHVEDWQEALHRVGGVWFSFDRSGEVVYALNDTDFLRKRAHGFRFLANVTPHVTAEDIERWDEKHEEGEDKPEPGDVRTFAQMAAAAAGAPGLGVLRMDVDSLGQVMVHGLKERSMATTSALSAALDLFFAGYLNILCQEVQQDRPESLYVIYSGGDDLFIVGAWDLMPLLAERIQSDFSRYTGGNPSLTISGAVTIEGEKFPLYQAAERAGQAEEKAKQYSRVSGGLEKNAFHFLGMEVGWEEWKQVTGYREDIEKALTTNHGAPRALLQILQNIYLQRQYQKDRRKSEIGPWVWRGAYALSRLAGRIPDETAREAVTRLAKSCLHPDRIRLAALAARWEELFTRKES